MKTTPIEYKYQKHRFEFGRTTHHFSNSDNGVLIDLERSSKYLKEHTIKKTKLDKGISSYTNSVHSVNTYHIPKINKGVKHNEGGWPLEIAVLDNNVKEKKKQKRIYLENIEKQKNFKDEIQNCVDKIIPFLDQNNCLNINEIYFSKTPNFEPKPQDNVKFTKKKQKDKITISHIFKNNRKINNISWNIKGDKIGVSHSTKGENRSSFIWDLNNCIKPSIIIQPMDNLSFMEFHPKEYSYIIGGNFNGRIEIFDTRRGVKSVNYSVKSHKDKINDIKWIQSKNLNQCVSVANDSNCYFWDIRNLGNPILEHHLGKGGVKFNGISLFYDLEYSISKLLIGTKEGYVLNFNKKSKKVEKFIEKVYFEKSTSPVFSVQRNPFFKKFFLTISDWSIKIWNDDFVNNPLFETENEDNYLLDGKWSKTKSSICYTTNSKGEFGIWDLEVNQRKPIFKKKISSYPVKSLNIYSNKLIATADTNGNCYILNFNSEDDFEFKLNDYSPNQNANANFRDILEREYKREKYLITRK